MTDLITLYGVATKTDEIEIIAGCSWDAIVYVTDSEQAKDFSFFNGYCHWLNVSWDTVAIEDNNKLIELNVNAIAPTIRAGVYDVSYLISLTPDQTAILTIGTTIYGDLLITDNSEEIIVRRFKAKVKGRATLRT